MFAHTADKFNHVARSIFNVRSIATPRFVNLLKVLTEHDKDRIYFFWLNCDFAHDVKLIKPIEKGGTLCMENLHYVKKPALANIRKKRTAQKPVVRKNRTSDKTDLPKPTKSVYGQSEWEKLKEKQKSWKGLA